ncbi:Monooxygenase FAD-binding [Penicillium hordei]|uniref:Monooxygenase FAD-binding n=1 Tax=Penicillium hordei TaxID=40994 RepID=A0AAD6E1Z3_9EURO|nr:Monooxygenase FAD-binding [Penicillium hordei]KAJ5598576.1 Monooxygenase FAD-binding [Penicillium hordei]
MTLQSFKAIIIGGGPVGITAAHALHHAGIDFIVLEQRDDIFEDVGASLVISPHNLRVFHQFGLLEKLFDIGYPFLHHNEGFNTKKSNFKRSYALSLLQKNHGSALMTFHRAQLIRTLYDGLPEVAKARYRTGKKLSDIVVSSNDVRVICTDGTSFSGSVVIGADGAHSRTRLVMRRHALEANPSLAPIWDVESPYTSNYRCLWASIPRLSGPGDSYEMQGPDRSVVYLTGRERSWIFLYEKLSQASNKRVFYDDNDRQLYGATFCQWPLTETLTVSDVLHHPSCIAGMANLEEGIVENISWSGRIVLVGDAYHKFTPNSGLGFNNGIQDVVSLCNQLHMQISSCIASPAGGEALDQTVVQAAFDKYQHERKPFLEADYARSTRSIRRSTWATSTDYLFGRYILSLRFVQKFLITHSICPGISRGLVLNYIPASEPLVGEMLWENLIGKSK